MNVSQRIEPALAPPAQADVLVIGAGINGAGIARDLAGRGLSVVLCDKDDLASHTSSASTKLIHGGLRYLEQFDFAMVRKALVEREVLLRSAPHIMWPLRFVMPHDPHMRPAWLIRLGLLLYDNLARREFLASSSGIALRDDPVGRPLRREYTRGFTYSDGWVDDARLVVLCARDAADHGARILTRTECRAARRHNGAWDAELLDQDGQVTTLRARAIVNATGPWVHGMLRDQLGVPTKRRLRLVKGSHIVVPRLFDHDSAYIFQSRDKRIVFAIPFQDYFTLIGTTDLEFHGDPGQVRINDDEIAYLCALTKRYFARPVVPGDVVWSYSGVRPLLDDAKGNASKVSRDYCLEINTDAAPVLTVWGGKITTFRKLAEEAADLLLNALQMRREAWTATAVLPGGDLGGALTESNQRMAHSPELEFERFCRRVVARWPFLPVMLARRYARAYGSRLELILSEAKGLSDLGEEIAPGVFEAELDYLVKQEWARFGDDVLWRRTKLGLHLDEDQRRRVALWVSARARFYRRERGREVAASAAASGTVRQWL